MQVLPLACTENELLQIWTGPGVWIFKSVSKCIELTLCIEEGMTGQV